MTIDPLDISNVGFFMKAGDDIDELPLLLRLNDLRCRGKGISLGEYGVKTHPAWAGTSEYRTTAQEQNRLFLAVSHYALGIGASKVQNWCLSDPATRVFPWGLIYPHQSIPKDVAYVLRDQSLIWRHFRPQYVAPPIAVCLPNQLRLGNDRGLGQKVVYRTSSDLLALHYNFNCLDDDHLEQIAPATKVLIYPAPTSLCDEAYAKLLAWVRNGGTLLLTGDFSYDTDRRRTRSVRLEELAGIRSLAVNFSDVQRAAGRDERAEFSLPPLRAHDVRPAIRAEAIQAEVLGKTVTGQPVLLRNRVGRGTVYYCTDPIELAGNSAPRDLYASWFAPEGVSDELAGSRIRQDIYAAVLRASGMNPLPIEPAAPWLHVMAQPTVNGATIHVVFNTRKGTGTQKVSIPTAAGDVRLNVRNGWPAMVAVTRDGKVVAMTTDGEAAVGGDPIVAGSGLKMLLSLDGKDLRSSDAILIGPCEPGYLELPFRSDKKSQAVVGDFQAGCWTAYERRELRGEVRRLEVDPDVATCLILICRPDEESRWSEYLTTTMLHPDKVVGY